ncbi:MAG: hypothetical protein ACYTGL_06475 [Planctomycetota bacterium]|jgi:hypothetical protein
MATLATQPICGVSSNSETEVRSRYPSIAANAIGQFIGSICESIPARIWGMKLSHLLFALPLAPLGLLVYAYQKVMGVKYVLTNRSIQVWSVIGGHQLRSAALTDIADIELTVHSGQEFYHAGDLTLVGEKGDVLLTLPGVVRPDIFRENILKAGQARKTTEESLATIAARG